MYSGGRITQDSEPASGDTIYIQDRPALYWNAEKKEWQIAGLCDACRLPFHGDPEPRTIRVWDGPMMYNDKRLLVCSDQIKCQQAFRKLVDVNAKLRSQGR